MNHMNLGDGGCSEWRSSHYTTAWVIKQDPISKKIEKEKKVRYVENSTYALGAQRQGNREVIVDKMSH